MKCPDCESEVIIGTRKTSRSITIKIKCTKCNRKVIKTRKRGDYTALRKSALITWNNSIEHGRYGVDFD